MQAPRDEAPRKSGVRSHNLATVTTWIESARAGRATAGLIAGRPGMGKSVLAGQALQVARHFECVTATAAGRSREAPPLVVNQLAEQLRVTGANEGMLSRAVREEVKRLGSIGRTTTLVFEDIQDLSAADLAFLEDLVLFPPTQRLAVLLTHRTVGEVEPDDPTLRMLDRLEAARTLEVLMLDRLTEAEAAPLVAGGFPPGAVTPRFIRDAVAFTGGNPQWIDSLIREALRLPEEERAAMLTGSQLLGDTRMPPSVTRAVDFRFVPYQDERPVAEALAVWGAPAMPSILASLSGRSAAEVERALERLERAGIMKVDGDGAPAMTVDFTEPIVAAALRTLMPRTAHLRVQRAALELADSSGSHDESSLSRLASRYLEAAEVLGAREIDEVLATARDQIERSRFEAARSLLSRLVERLRMVGQAVPSEALVLLAESHSRAGAFDEASRILAEISDGDEEQDRRRLMRAARDSVAIGREIDALGIYERLLEDETLEPLERAQILLDAARVDSSMGHPASSARRRASAAVFAEAGGDLGLAGIARLEEALLWVQRGRHVSLRDVSRAFGRAWSSSARGVSARATSNVAYILVDCSTVGRAARWWRRAMRLAEHQEDYAALSSIALALARAELELGEWQRADQTIATAVHIDASLHRTRALRGSRAIQSMLSALRGQTGGLDLPLDDTFRVAEGFGGPLTSILDFCARFEHRMRLGELEQAEEMIGRAEALLMEREGFERSLLVEVLPRAALVHYRQGDPAALQRVIETFGSYAEASGRTLPVLRPLTYQMQAYETLLRGDDARAADLAAAAGDRFASLGYRWRAAIAHRDAGEASRRAGAMPEAKLQFESAFRLFSEMGAIEQLGQVRQEMSSLGMRARRTRERQTALTARQWQIAELASRGMSDPQIADALGISKRTVSTHMHHILRALGLQSRLQLEAWTSSHQQDRARALGDMM